MSAFWLWFIRPIAEVLGGIALIVVLMGILWLVVEIINWRNRK